MTVEEVMHELELMGNEGTKKILVKHGAKEPFFGVKVADLKKIVKKVKKDHELSLALYETGNSDAMYLAGLIGDETKITKEDLLKWADEAYWYMISEYTVPWLSAESPYGLELGLHWIEQETDQLISCGWATLANVVLITPDEELDLQQMSTLLDRAAEDIHSGGNREKYTRNGFILSVGCSIASLTEKAKKLGAQVGKVNVDMGGTACKVPSIETYISKNEEKGRIGKKKKKARC